MINILNCGKQIPVIGCYVEKFLSSTDQKTLTKIPDEVISYEDKSKEGKVLSSTRVARYLPSSTPTTYKSHKSLKALSEYISLQRNPSSKNLAQESSNASFSSKNRGDLKTEVTLSEDLKEVLGLQGKSDEEIQNLLGTESIYKHNSEYNGHSYLDEKGKFVQIHSAIESSADRKAVHTQNLTLVKQGGENLLYTGRPDTLHKAKEQALFLLSHKSNVPHLEEVTTSDALDLPPKWLEKAKGLTWNPTLKCVEFSYAVYSLMSDSMTSNLFYNLVESPENNENNERKFLKAEIKALESLKQGPITVKDASGHVFKLHCKPILLSQTFNAFSTLKAFTLEGGVSAPLMQKAYKEICELLNTRPNQAEKLKPHLETLNAYFMGNRSLSPLHLFLHMNLVLQEISGENEELPLVLHCKSSTDRTGIGAAVLASVKQMKRLGMIIPSDMNLLTKDPKFKELFALNWIPTWHQRSEYSRDVAGISFGTGISQNPIVLECLPERYLVKSHNPMRWIGSGLFSYLSMGILKNSWIANRMGQILWYEGKNLAGKTTSKEEIAHLHAVRNYRWNELLEPPFYPHISVNKKGLAYKSGKAALSPLQKLEKQKL